MRAIHLAVLALCGGLLAAQAVGADPVRSLATGVAIETEPPSYVLSEEATRALLRTGEWGMRIGSDYRLRFEDHSATARPGLIDDTRWLSRARLYLSVRPSASVVGAAVELQDSRRWSSELEDSPAHVDHLDFLQAYLSVRWPGEQPRAEFRAGRMAFDFIDRRQVGRHRWRNTSTAFDGVRILAEPSRERWTVQGFLGAPVEIRTRGLDARETSRWIALASVRREWRDERLAVEPYWIRVRDDDPDQTVQSLGLHVFGDRLREVFDYDVDLAVQRGETEGLDRVAWAVFAESGWSSPDWRGARLSLAFLYASGDEDPTDDEIGRFDGLFQPGHPFSTADLARSENLILTRARARLPLHARLRATVGFASYRLAESADAWTATGVVDPSGNSGRRIGEEYELALTARISPRTSAELGVAWWAAGAFSENAAGFDGGGLLYAFWEWRL